MGLADRGVDEDSPKFRAIQIFIFTTLKNCHKLWELLIIVVIGYINWVVGKHRHDIIRCFVPLNFKYTDPIPETSHTLEKCASYYLALHSVRRLT